MQPVIFETFSFSGESMACYGLEIVKNTLAKHGISCIPFAPDSKNPVLVSLYWPEQIYNFIRWRYQACMKGRKVYLGGNYPTTSPSACLAFCDGVFLGDGELWNGSDDSQFFAKSGKPRSKATAQNIACFPYEDTQFSRRAFVEIARGCRNKCLFCQYGWLKEYREADIQDIKIGISACKTKTIRVFAADRFQHSRYLDIRKIIEKKGKCDSGSDISIKFLLKNPEYLQMTNKVRVGIEGISERLRKMILKPYSNDDIVRFCMLVADAGIKCLDWYMIYGLPTERAGDEEDFFRLISSLDERLPEGYVIAIHWNAFTPSAQTPFQWATPARGRPKYMQRIFSELRNKRIKIYHKPKFTSDWTIARRMLAIRASSIDAQLLFNFAKKESEFKKNPEALSRAWGKGDRTGLLDEWPVDIPMPWDSYCLYRKDDMKKCWDVAMKRNRNACHL